jgi:hypothetical protein
VPGQTVEATTEMRNVDDDPWRPSGQTGLRDL